MRLTAALATTLGLVLLASPALGDDGRRANDYPRSIGNSVDPWNHTHWPVRVNSLERIEWKYTGGKHPGMAAPGTDGLVRAMAGAGHLRAIDPATGKHKWVATSNARFWNYSSSVTGPDGTAYYGNHTWLQAVDASGERLWRVDLRAGWIHRPPALSPDGETLYVVSDGVALASLVAKTGQINWLRRDFKAPWSSLCFDPEGQLIIGTGEAVSCLDAQGRKVWKIEEPVKDLMVFRHFLLGTVARDGELRCWDIRSRKRLWTAKLESEIAGIALGDDARVRVALTSGELANVSIAGRVRWKTRVSDDALARPATALDGDTLVCDAAGVLHLVDDAGGVEQSFATGAKPFRWRPAVGPDGAVYVTHAADLVRISGAPRAARQRPVASALVVVADDFVVDIWVNGKKLPDSAREMQDEIHGAMSELVHVDLQAGDWIVFNVVSNRLRWGGSSYFGVFARNWRGRTAFTSTTKGNWSACDDPDRVKEFIADRDAGADRLAQAPTRPWHDAKGLWQKYLGREFPGEAVWGTSRNTWIKCIVPPAR